MGQASISSIASPTGKVDSLCSRWYDLTRQATLQAFRWSFATKGESIPRAGTPAHEYYADAYQFPNDYLKLLAIVDPLASLQSRDFMIEGKQLLMNNGGASSIKVWFTYDVTAVAQFPPTFKNLLAMTLARKICPAITKAPGVLKTVKEEYNVALKEALAFNGQENPPRRYEKSAIVDAGRNMASRQYVAGPYEFLFDY